MAIANSTCIEDLKNLSETICRLQQELIAWSNTLEMACEEANLVYWESCNRERAEDIQPGGTLPTPDMEKVRLFVGERQLPYVRSPSAEWCRVDGERCEGVFLPTGDHGRNIERCRSQFALGSG